MFYTYAISSQIRNYIYVGLSGDIDRRLSEHNSGKNKTTKPYLPFILIYSEEHETRIKARLREKYFKSGVGREKLRIIRDNRIV